jgi:hypothetical protein
VFFLSYKNHLVFRIRDLVRGLDPSFDLDADPYGIGIFMYINLFRENNFYSSAKVSAETHQMVLKLKFKPMNIHFFDGV